MSQPPSHQQHREAATPLSARCVVLTVSDTRTPETDHSGDCLAGLLDHAGHQIVARVIVPDEPTRIEAVLTRYLSDPTVDVLLFNGGTGIAHRDRTYDVVAARLEKVLPGFGEIFRILSYEQVGAAAMLSRAVGGVAGGKLLFSLPGSEQAVRLAAEKLLVPELSHLVWELRR